MTGPQGAVAATFFDGQTAQRHAVRIAPTSDGLGLAVLFDDAARGHLSGPSTASAHLTDKPTGPA